MGGWQSEEYLTKLEEEGWVRLPPHPHPPTHGHPLLLRQAHTHRTIEEHTLLCMNSEDYNDYV